MKISLNNISKVKKADIEIKGITVIAGENNTGKSTVGKALWSIFNSFYNIKKELKIEREETILKKIMKEIDIDKIKDINFVRKVSRKLSSLNLPDKKEIEKILLESFKVFNKDSINNLVKDVYEILSLEDEYILKNHLENILLTEFNGQINNLYNNEEGEIDLKIADKEISIKIDSQKIKSVENIEKLNLSTEAVYIDDPYILDDSRVIYSKKGNHKNDLKVLLSSKKNISLVDNALLSKKIEKIDEKLEEVFKEEMVFNFYDKKIKLKNSMEELEIKNLSTGLKTFVILKNLIDNGALEERGTIILDEPEIHLHPEWQLVFAEIIVMLQVELNLHILLATHSPYFLRAIQVYAGNYGIADKCKYYLAENEENYSVIKDVSDEVELIFKKLARPLQKLEDLLYERF